MDQNPYYNIFLEIERPFYISLCDRNPDLNTLEFQIRAATFLPSQKILKKELILNQGYLPHPDSSSAD